MKSFLDIAGLTRTIENIKAYFKTLIDSSYDPTSENAQSGSAVEEAIAIHDIELRSTSVTGKEINIEDSAEMTLEGLNVYGKTTQGENPSPENPQTLINVGSKGNVVIRVLSKNLIPYPYADGTTKTVNGITFTVNSDGSVTVNGTATAKATYAFYKPYSQQAYNTLDCNLSYTISDANNVCKAGGMMVEVNIRSFKTDAEYENKFLQTNYVSTIKPDTSCIKRWIPITHLIVPAGYTANNETVYPQFEVGTEATSYEPYKVQTITVPTSGGLPGIPVSSGGNYTDANGQQWVCDEIDLERGVYISNIQEVTVPQMNYIVKEVSGNPLAFAVFDVSGCKASGGLLTNAQYYGNGYPDTSNFFGLNEKANDIIEVSFYGTLAENPSYYLSIIDELNASYKGQNMLLIKSAPTETPLDETLLEAYRDLTTYYPTTNIFNDSDAYMKVRYVSFADFLTANTKLADLPGDSQHRTVTDEEKENWNNHTHTVAEKMYLNGATEKDDTVFATYGEIIVAESAVFGNSISLEGLVVYVKDEQLDNFNSATKLNVLIEGDIIEVSRSNFSYIGTVAEWYGDSMYYDNIPDGVHECACYFYNDGDFEFTYSQYNGCEATVVVNANTFEIKSNGEIESSYIKSLKNRIIALEETLANIQNANDSQ